MLRFLFFRLLQGVGVLALVISATFLLMRLAPGSPFVAGERKLSPEIEARLLKQYGLDGSIGEQFIHYWKNILTGNLGESMQYANWSVSSMIAQMLPHSALLGLCAIGCALIIGIGLGSYSAARHQKVGDRFAMLLALFGISLPTFVIAPIFILIFSLWLKMFPVAGWGSLKHMVLPTLCLGLPYGAYCARLVRTSMLETLNQDFIRTARAKGLHEVSIVLLHALKVGLLPLISYLGPLTAHILTGSLVIEELFKIPGIGPLFIQSVLSRDLFVVGALVMIYCALLIFMNLLVDLAYAAIDPRIRAEVKS